MATASDAELILKLYELRQEERLRAARNWVMQEFNPRTLDELLAVQRDLGSLHNQYWRQVISYWEMAAALIDAHPPARDRCARLREFLQARAGIS